jgi:hypothetical protein
MQIQLKMNCGYFYYHFGYIYFLSQLWLDNKGEHRLGKNNKN